jgi:Tfp pilus assembly protein PilE
MSFCVVIAGRLPGAEDDRVVWGIIARGFQVDDSEFAERMIPRLPLVVKQGLDEPMAKQMAETLVASGIDARALADDGTLAVFEREGVTKGPVPFTSLGDFIRDGERYRKQGERQWSTWASKPADAADPAAIWVARDGQKYGPYTEATVRQWLGEGKLTLDMLAWRAGMPEWVALASLLGEPPPAPFGFAGSPRGSTNPVEARRELPKPPSLHWFVVALLSVVTLGIFAWVWFFVQASWIKKIDRHSSARTMFMAALGLALAGGFFAVATRGLGNLLTLASVILVVVATFSMANSVRQLGKRLALPVRFGNLTLFIFQSWYLQGTLTWLARWKETGQAAPEPPKAALWLVMAVPFALAILAAIAIPGFEEARARRQVAAGVAVADKLKASVTKYYQHYGAFPEDNAAMGLQALIDFKGEHAQAFRISKGTLDVIFTKSASYKIRDRHVTMTPSASASGVTWDCVAPDIPKPLLPSSCQ